MTDHLSKEKRSWNMSKIRSTNSKPEEIVRKFLRFNKIGYRKNVKNLPGKPDIVLNKYNTVIFVNGCFWHCHQGCPRFRFPKSNQQYWIKKLNRNVERDAKVYKELEDLGWNVLIIWECELKKSDAQANLERIIWQLEINKSGVDFFMDEETHRQILLKFQALQGQVIYGKKQIKGIDEKRVLPDKYVDANHIMHDLIRGFYKPKGRDYMLSYQATEKDENYGPQINWLDEEKGIFDSIDMRPPNSEKDNRKKSDIEAARFNLYHEIPIGILHWKKKGVNQILGLGMIVSENTDGTFKVVPYEFKDIGNIDK
ncbi:very short patch repair endonuclease [Enterococcus quebecensis]|uniref:Very short patch repair endonuclease n=1 Tax=Enterococcus quebecensis TaxID=903983 RepID=A0A1E5GUT9_9ENTE|nr:very short patch repair endonuclease [Enterococcus quebecensis]OEG16464.1 hypothetical protein BCR23_06135 [Enterococcus quebecensis]OJG74168.1 hypothetical protein RV12_GL002806 [Enterococcus quebecensis]